jgi:OOP family OmpA-OmpF porin
MLRFRARGVVVLIVVLAAAAAPAQAQSWRDRLKQAKAKVESAVDQAGDSSQATTSASATDGAAAGDAASSDAAPAASKVDVNYDFVPGDQVLFQDDFASDPVGDLPTHVQVLSGNWEIAVKDGRRMLRSTSGGDLMIPLPSVLPSKFTLELELIHDWGWDTRVYFVDADHRDGMQNAVFGSDGGIGDFSSSANEDRSDKLYHARIMADGRHVKVYIDGKRVANVPSANLGRANGIWIQAPADDNSPFYLASVRVAASQTSLFDALNASGRVSTHGILFATGSAEIQPGSAGTLEQIGQMLQQHPELKLTIEGHTDNVGQPAANLQLSQRRADAVKAYLVSKYGVAAGRLDAKGYGDTKPVASNDSDAGRQQNRRVELVKM